MSEAHRASTPPSHSRKSGKVNVDPWRVFESVFFGSDDLPSQCITKSPSISVNSYKHSGLFQVPFYSRRGINLGFVLQPRVIDLPLTSLSQSPARCPHKIDIRLITWGLNVTGMVKRWHGPIPVARRNSHVSVNPRKLLLNGHAGLAGNSKLVSFRLQWRHRPTWFECRLRDTVIKCNISGLSQSSAPLSTGCSRLSGHRHNRTAGMRPG